ncbi:extracellular solute-binding protein [Roseibacterium sp. SDUM158017]|uniref:extracellular solute-binding protein n=1 Tax=Roseicyclus salinarum TaxID=3036773 RepID=UPI00241506F3|nr:extracellular solute-binding protein [Roseibacterium sp. SDUM158017]MDG4647118.1 extracellular solute-binding protein [Roseibacterium sp. SDUM158017]
MQDLPFPPAPLPVAAIAARRMPPAPRLAALPLVGAAALWAIAALPAPAQQDDTLVVTHAVATFGLEDLTYPADFAHLSYVNPDAPRGGEMSLSWSSAGGSFDSMHPYTNQGNPAVLSSIFFESMLEGTLDTIGESYCLLCETIAYPEDKSYVIFTIRENARFSDGTPVTADDALFSYEILRDEGLPSFRANLPNTIDSATVLDERRIRFDFNPESQVRGRIEAAGGLPVFSRQSHVDSGRDFDESRLEPLVGSGPYILGDVDPGRSTVFERDPDYWGWDLPINQGRHNFDSIRVEYYADAIAAFEGFTAGNYMFRQENSSQNWATSYDFPRLRQGIVIREDIPQGLIASGQSFVFNLRREKFQDPRVREAIALMFNFEWTNQTLFYGLYSPIDSFWENTHLEAEGIAPPEELAVLEPLRGLLPDEVFTEPPFATPASDPDRTFDRRQARRATQLLQEAGWTPGDDGMLRNEAGQTLEVEFLNAGPLFDRIINPYVENLRAIGIDARMNRVDGAQMSQRQRNADFDILTDHYPMSYEPGTSLRQYFGTLGADEALFNVAGLADEGVDRLLETVIRAETREEMEVATRALDRVLRAHRIRVPQWFNDSSWVAYYNHYRHPEVLPPYGIGYLDFWWVDPEAAAELREQGVL